MIFIVTFALSGIIWLPLILMFAIGGTDTKNRIVGSLICLCFWLLMAGGTFLEAKGNRERWNDGYCTCGAHWELAAVTKPHNGSITKYYVCPNCYAEIQIK